MGAARSDLWSSDGADSRFGECFPEKKRGRELQRDLNSWVVVEGGS